MPKKTLTYTTTSDAAVIVGKTVANHNAAIASVWAAAKKELDDKVKKHGLKSDEYNAFFKGVRTDVYCAYMAQSLIKDGKLNDFPKSVGPKALQAAFIIYKRPNCKGQSEDRRTEYLESFYDAAKTAWSQFVLKNGIQSPEHSRKGANANKAKSKKPTAKEKAAAAEVKKLQTAVKSAIQNRTIKPINAVGKVNSSDKLLAMIEWNVAALAVALKENADQYKTEWGLREPITELAKLVDNLTSDH